MEDWVNKAGQVKVNHYWQNMWDFPDMFFHHH